MKAFYYTIFIPLAFACNQAPTSDQQITSEQTTNKDSVTIAVTDNSEISEKQKTFDMTLNGPWTDGSSENATFSIDDKKIFFVEHLTTEKLFMKGDTAMVYAEDDSLSNLSYKIYKIHSDTLVYDDNVQKTKYWKFNG